MLDLLVVLLYLIITLFVGIYSGRGLKTLKDYAVSKRDFDVFSIVATVSATLIGGGTAFGIAQEVYTRGLIFIAIISGAALNQILVSKYIIPRMNKFGDVITTGELIKKLYGKNAQSFSSIFIVLISLGFFATQISALGYVCNYFLDFPTSYGIVFGGIFIALYASMGGIRAVVMTDVVQFAVLIVAIPILVSLSFQKVGGLGELLVHTPKNFIFFSIDSFFEIENISQFFIFAIIGAFYPSIIQRFLIAKNINVAKKAVFINAIISLPFYLIVGGAGLAALHLNPDMDSNLSMPFLINNILPVIIKGLVVSGILAVIMSTADSELNIAVVSIMQDIILNLYHKKISDKTQLTITKMLALFISFGSIILALYFDGIIQIMMFSFSFWAPTILVPLVAGLFDIKISKKSFFICCMVGIFSMISWNIYLKECTKVDGVLPGFVFCLLVFLIIWCIENRSFPLKLLLNLIKINVLSKWNELKIKYLVRCDNLLPQYIINNSNYVSFCYYGIIIFTLPSFIWPINDKFEYYILFFRLVAALICFIMLFSHYKYKSYKYKLIIWYCALIYCISFLSFFTLLTSNFSVFWVVNTLLSLILLIILIGNIRTWIVAIIGAMLSLILFKMLGEELHSIDLNFYQFIDYFYLGFIVLLVIGIFYKNNEHHKSEMISTLESEISAKTKHLRDALDIRKKLLNNLSHEMQTPLHGIIGISSVLEESFEQNSQIENKKYLEQIKLSGKRLSKLVKNIIELYNLENNPKDFIFENCDIQKELQKIVADIKLNNNIPSHKITFDHFPRKVLIAKLDKQKIYIMLEQVLLNAIQYGNNKDIKIIIQTSFIQNYNHEVEAAEIIVSNMGVEISKGEEKIIFNSFTEGSSTKNNSGGRGIGLTIAKTIIESHNGQISAKSHNNITNLVFKIPLINVEKSKKKRLLSSYFTLIVDSEFVLKEYDNNIIMTNNGMQVLSILEHCNVNMIFLNLNLKDIYGIELIKKIRDNSRYRDIEIYIIDDNFDISEVREAYNLGAKELISREFILQTINK